MEEEEGDKCSFIKVLVLFVRTFDIVNLHPQSNSERSKDLDNTSKFLAQFCGYGAAKWLVSRPSDFRSQLT